MTDVQLIDVTEENWRAVAELQVLPSQQRFTRSALFSIAEAQFYPDARLKAIMGDEGRPVGLVLYGLDDTDGHYWIFRLLLDAAQQRKGYGRAAVDKVIGELTAVPECQDVWVRYYPDNLAAEALYRSSGFSEVGDVKGQVLARFGVTT